MLAIAGWSHLALTVALLLSPQMVFPKVCFLSMIPVYQISLEPLRFQGNFMYKFWGLSNYGRVPQDGQQEHPSAESPSYDETNNSSYQSQLPPHQKNRSVRYNIYYVYTSICIYIHIQIHCIGYVP